MYRSASGLKKYCRHVSQLGVPYVPERNFIPFLTTLKFFKLPRSGPAQEFDSNQQANHRLLGLPSYVYSLPAINILLIHFTESHL